MTPRRSRGPIHPSRVFDALGFRFTVAADDPTLAAYLHELLHALQTEGSADHHYVLRATSGNDHVQCEVRLDGTLVGGPAPAAKLVPTLVHDLNRRAVEGADLLRFHAGGVEYRRVGLILPAGTESGKTTLVAGLVRAGFGYLTDEAVALDRDTLMIRPYPKPLSLDRGSWPLFPELEPHVDLATDDYKRAQWQVPAEAIRPGALGSPCRVRVIAFPRYEPGAETVLEQLGRAEGLVELAANTFGSVGRSRATFDLLADVVRTASCYRLTFGALEPAVALVSSLAEREAA